MALPTAQLGGMASLNVPSYIPTVQVQKEPKAWEKILLSVLANAAGSVVGQGVENVMSRDAAAEFDKTPSGGFDRLLRGPKVGVQEATQRRGLAAQKEIQETEINAAALLAQLRGIQGETEQQAAQHALRMSDLERGSTQSMLNDQETIARSRVQRGADARADMRTNAEIGAEAPYRAAQTNRLDAETEQIEQAISFMKQAMASQQAVGGSDTSLTPQQVAVQNRLQDTSRYPTAEALLTRAQTSNPTAVDDPAVFSEHQPVEPGLSASAPSRQPVAGPQRNRRFEENRTQTSRPVVDSTQAEAQALLKELVRARTLLTKQNEKGRAITGPRIENILLRLDQLSAANQ